ncbi:MAG TPA: hypothetical protein VHS31_20010 [Tepidisphaeraceae bacterium]|jgi:hypothetical protein|nr:hypothetical protein [Tepidisphaeraceae bacterium]
MNKILHQMIEVEQSGREAVDALAAQRAAENPLTRDCAVCQSCGRSASSADLWSATWSYYYFPNRAVGALITLAAATGIAFVHHYMRQARHQTYHVICNRCSSSVRRNRIIGGLLRFVGLFIAICGLGMSLAGICWWAIANAHDRQMIQTWIAVPVGGLVLGSVLAHLATGVGTPSMLRPIQQRPFILTSFKHVGGA